MNEIVQNTEQTANTIKENVLTTEKNTNDQDHKNDSMKLKKDNVDSTNINSAKSNKTKKSKENPCNISSHKCRCSVSSTSGTTNKCSDSKTSRHLASTDVNATLLLNFKDLSVRKFEKLSSIPIKTSENDNSIELTTISLNKTNNNPKKTKTRLCSSNSIVSNHNDNGKNCMENVKKNEHENNASEFMENESMNGKTNNHVVTDNTNLRLDNSNLESKSRRYSSSSVINMNGNNSNKKLNNKSKERTKTDSHLLISSSSTKKQEFTFSTLTKNSHSSNKCNCGSCKQLKSSSINNDNQNKTKSVGTQHNANAYDPWVKRTPTSNNNNNKNNNKNDCSSNKHFDSMKANSFSDAVNLKITQKLADSNAKVIVITDDFKRKALDQEVVVDTKKKILRYMKANKMVNSSRSMDDVLFTSSDKPEINSTKESIKIDDKSKNTIEENSCEPNISGCKQKAISKSVDNISLLSNEMDLDNFGSVELIFISDEFLKKLSKPDVIVLKNNSKYSNRINRKPKQLKHENCSNPSDPNDISINSPQKLTTSIQKQNKNIELSDDFQHNMSAEINDATVIVESTQSNSSGDGISANRKPKLNCCSSAGSSIDDVNNKLTSHAFRSYDEDQENLENKEIKSPIVDDIPN